MNRIFFGLVLIAFLAAGWRQLQWEPPPPPPAVEQPAPTGDPVADEILALKERVGALESPEGPARPRSPMEQMTESMLDAAKSAVELSISLIGVMTLFLGLMKVAEAGGLLTIIAKLLRPLMVRAFPDVPPDHPAMGAMILNMSANALGLGNAATPFGIRAMQELDKLNPHKGTATNAMALFLAINTSGVTILPTGVIAIRDAMGSGDAAGILSTTLFATTCSTVTAFIAIKLYQRFSPFVPGPVEPGAPGPSAAEEPQEDISLTEASEAYPLWASVLGLLCVLGIIPVALIFGNIVSPWIIPLLMVGLLGFGAFRKVPVYEVFVAGARDGFQVAVRIIPYLVAILVAVAMFRASGALDWFVAAVSPISSRVGLPAEAVPMALLRPLSGSGALAIMTATMEDAGPDSYTGYLVSTLQGSTETTFYVLAVYFGAVGVQRIRHTMAAALTADLAGIIGSIIGVSAYFTFNGLW